MEIMEKLEKRLEELEKKVDKNQEAISDLFGHLVKRIKSDIEFQKRLGMITIVVEQIQKMMKASTITIAWIAHLMGSK